MEKGMKGMALVLILGLIVGICGCAGEQKEPIRLMEGTDFYEGVEYYKEPVKRGDLTEQIQIVSQFLPREEWELGFETGGLLLSALYVEVGDEVTEGEILAELDCSDLEEELFRLEAEQEKLYLRLDYLTKLSEIDKEYGGSGAEWKEELLQTEGSLEVTALKIQECEEKAKKRRIYAPMDGTVSYIAEYEEDQRSVRGEPFITVIDTELTLQALTTDGDYLYEGMPVEIMIRDEIYNGSVTEVEQIREDRYEASFYLEEPVQFPQGTRGIITIVLEEKEDVLYVPVKAIGEIDGKTVVFYEDENGLKAYKEVTIGYEADGKVEILDGLEEGDLVIL